MFDGYESGPIDSDDMLAMGLRSARCNGCSYLTLKWQLGDKFHVVHSKEGWTDVYELDAEPGPGQGEPQEVEGRPVRFRGGFMSIGHSDECWHFTPPDYPFVPKPAQPPHIQGKTWRTATGTVIPISDLTNRHLINILRLAIRMSFPIHSPAVMALRKEARRRDVTVIKDETNVLDDAGIKMSLDELLFPDCYTYRTMVDKVTCWRCKRGALVRCPRDQTIKEKR